MNTIQRIGKNMGVYGFSQVISSILGFILLIYIARLLGEAQYGTYSFAITFTSLFIVIADMGISEYITREIARNKNLTREYIANVLLIKTILSLITIGSIIFIINLIEFDQKYIIYFFGIYTILSNFSLMFMSIFKAYEKLEYNALIITMEKIVLISLGLLVLNLGYGIIGLAYVYLTAGIIDFILSFIIFLLKINEMNLNINLKIWKPLIVDSIPFSINTLFTMLFFRADIILLGFLIGNTAVGIYTAAYSPLLALSVLITSMAVSAIYPVMSRYFVTSTDSLEKLTLISSKYMIIIGIPLTIGSFILADKIIGFFYAGNFLESIIVFQILAFFIPIRLVNGITGTLLTSINKQGIRSFSFLLCTIFNIIINLLLIPYLSYIGASIATVLSEIFLYIIFIYLINKHHKNIKLNGYYIKPFMSSLIMGVFLFILKPLNLFLLIILGVIIYFICIILLKTFDTMDKTIFKHLIKKG